jgi:5'-nucleotidase / UDP-sugar diphosphatase
VAAKVARLAQRADEEMLEVVGRVDRPLDASRSVLRRGEGAFGNLVADLARELTGAQVALFNAGGIRASIPAGPVRVKDIVQAFPFRNELVVGTLSGATLQAVLDRSAGLDPLDDPGGFLQVSGLRMTLRDGRAKEVWVNGAPLDPAADYRVVLPDFLAAGGDGYQELTGLRDPLATGRILSDMLVEAFRGRGVLEATSDGRIRRL